MKIPVIIFFVFTMLYAKSQKNATIDPGQIAPAISLTNVDNKKISLDDYPSAKGFIIIFTCNTCPYAKAYEQRIIELNQKYTPLGFPVIAINPNDPGFSPGDSFEKMKQRAKSQNYNFPYLFDEGQVVTKLYGAKKTPHVFIVIRSVNNNIVQYTGAIDNDTQNKNPGKIKYVEDAIGALLRNEKPATTITKAIGCSVKYRN